MWNQLANFVGFLTSHLATDHASHRDVLGAGDTLGHSVSDGEWLLPADGVRDAAGLHFADHAACPNRNTANAFFSNHLAGSNRNLLWNDFFHKAAGSVSDLLGHGFADHPADPHGDFRYDYFGHIAADLDRAVLGYDAGNVRSAWDLAVNNPWAPDAAANGEAGTLLHANAWAATGIWN